MDSGCICRGEGFERDDGCAIDVEAHFAFFGRPLMRGWRGLD